MPENLISREKLYPNTGPEGVLAGGGKGAWGGGAGEESLWLTVHRNTVCHGGASTVAREASLGQRMDANSLMTSSLFPFHPFWDLGKCMGFTKSEA